MGVKCAAHETAPGEHYLGASGENFTRARDSVEDE
jgi:hypothetical protein